jgi:protein-L-isoaspartate(D-aspartate) O-methyltransferase
MRSGVEQANQRLVDQLIARGCLWSRPLIDAFRATPRHRFLDRVYHYQRQQGRWREIRTQTPGRGELRLVYADRALTTRLSEAAPGRPAVPISSSSQPSLMAQMLEDLRPGPGLRTLEIGAGTGYNAALLAFVAGKVVSLDVDRRVLAEAEEHLRGFPERRVEFVHGDGREGYPAAAPYDRIMVTASTPDLEPAWLAQTADGGVVQAPLALAPGLAFVVQGRVHGGTFEGRLTRPAYFMALRAESEAVRDEGPASYLPGPERLSAVTAPWADWAERNPAPVGGPSFLQALAFLGWLEGLTVAYQAGPDGRPIYGVGNLVQGHACWLGMREWRITGTAGRDLGARLWRIFLEAGGPWVTEYRLRARPRGEPALEPASGTLTYARQGTRCAQVWEWSAPRERP